MGKRLVSVLVLLLGGAMLFAAGTQEKTEAGTMGGTITLYTSVPQPIADKIQVDFENKFPGTRLDIFRSGTSDVVTKLMTEKEAGEIIADLVWVAEPSTYEDFKDQNLLLKFTPKEANALPAEMKDPEGYYYAGRLINMIIGYNTRLVSTPPRSWKDLLDARYSGKLGFPTPLRSGAAEATVRTLVDAYGWEYFQKFLQVGGKQIQNNSQVRDLLSTGELHVGVLLDYMIRGAKAKGSPVDMVWPQDGAVFIPSPIAVIRQSKNPQAAKTFVEYVISQEGQKTMVELGDFIPVRTDVAPPAGAPALGDINKLPTDWRRVQQKREETKDRWTDLFGE